MRILCPVCGEVLKLGERQWYCVKGHSFDVARQGYVNLLTVNQKHSKNPGDTRQMVAARKEFLDGGYYEPIVQMLVKAYVPQLDKALGVFLPLIVVNCIILGRAEMFASKNKPLDSALDGLGMGLGFTITLVVMASIREIVGSGSWFGMTIIPESVDRFTFMTTPDGGFFTFGILMALVIWLEEKLGKKVDRSIGCEGCPSKGACKGGCD